MCQEGYNFLGCSSQIVIMPAAALNNVESSHAAGQAICALCYACATRLTDCLAALMDLYTSVQTAGAAAPTGQSAMTEGDVKAVRGPLQCRAGCQKGNPAQQSGLCNAEQAAMTEGDVNVISGLSQCPMQRQGCGLTSPSNTGRHVGAEASATT